MKKTRRTSKVGEMIRDTLVQVFREDLKNVDLGLASITGVDVSPDLHFARVYISGFKEEETKATVKELQNAKGKIRHSLGQRIHLRYTPELDFKYDETTMRASRIEAILMEVAPKKTEDDSAAENAAATEGHDDDSDDNES
jgi:ribosome-binding factor A